MDGGIRRSPKLLPQTSPNCESDRLKQFNNTGANIEATPLVIDGAIFMVIEPGHVVALDDRTGDVIWEYKRPFPPDLPLIAGPVNRGLAVHGSTIFWAALMGIWLPLMRMTVKFSGKGWLEVPPMVTRLPGRRLS
jgi:hypothetical protein